MPRSFLYTSEAVSEGHPDKICDQISDAVVDAYLSRDPNAKTAVETAIKNNHVFLLGEISSSASLEEDEYKKIVENTLKRIGYDDAENSISWRDFDLHVHLYQQSQDIAQAVHENRSLEDTAAGDEGLMSAYATNETRSGMPTTFELSNLFSKKMTELMKDGTLPWLRPDNKTEVTVEYYEDEEGRLYPKRVDTIIVSTQHAASVSNDEIEREVYKHVILPVVTEFETEDLVTNFTERDYSQFNDTTFMASLTPQERGEIFKIPDISVISKTKLIKPDTKIFINPSGRFIIGGPRSDSGLTGRKIVCDAFGGWSAVGGGAFSGKDFSKVDRSGAYLARQICKSVIISGYARRCAVELSYAIGVADPISVYVDTYGFYDFQRPRGAQGVRSENELSELIRKTFEMRPGQIVKNFGLQRPIYEEIAAYGHFGRKDIPEADAKWEEVIIF